MFPAVHALTLQKIPPPAAHLCLDVENFVQKDLGHSLHHKKLLVGLSGGVDSVALLLLFYLLQGRSQFTLAAAHLHHGIRAEATRDQEFCQQLCEHLSISFYTTRVDIPALCVNGAGLEDAARTARYSYFASLRSSFDFDYLLTGHQLNDLAEDCFMRLLRGTGWPSLAGMHAYAHQRRQLRPLLMQPKQRLESFLLALNMPHVVDVTNDASFTLRNRIRHSVLPFFFTENPRFLERVASLWKQARIDEEGITELLKPIIQGTHDTLNPCSALKHKGTTESSETIKHPVPSEQLGIIKQTGEVERISTENVVSVRPPAQRPLSVTLTKHQLENLPQSIRLRAYKHVLEALGPGQALAETLFQLDRAWQQKKGKTIFQFAHGKTAQIENQSIVFKHRE